MKHSDAVHFHVHFCLFHKDYMKSCFSELRRAKFSESLKTVLTRTCYQGCTSNPLLSAFMSFLAEEMWSFCPCLITYSSWWHCIVLYSSMILSSKWNVAGAVWDWHEKATQQLPAVILWRKKKVWGDHFQKGMTNMYEVAH